jgi:bacterial/archaeal transporter family-2 protein
MESILLIILIGLAGGLAVGLQGPLASMLTQKLGIFESVFIVHLGGALIALIPMFVLGSRLGEWRSVPWYALGTGVFGLVVIGAISYILPRIGAAAAVTTIVAGQLLLSAALDHFGWLGATERALDAPRLFGLAVVFVGVWLTVR